MLAHAGGVPEFVSTGLVGAAVVTGWIGQSRLRGRGFGSLARPVAWGLVAVAPIALVASVVVPSRLWPPPSAVRPRSTATIAFVTPTKGQIVTEDQLDVHLLLTGGRIVQASSTTLTPDTGHIHLFLDGAIVSMTYGTVQRVSVADLSPGSHRLQAEYVAADHAPFDPRVTASVVFVKDDT
jgi:hypothetical protein